MLTLALTSVEATVSLIVIWFVVMPAVVTGLIAYALAQTAGERGENLRDAALRKRGVRKQRGA